MDAQLGGKYFDHTKQTMPVREYLALPIAVVGAGHPNVRPVLLGAPRDPGPDDVAMAHIGAKVLFARLPANLVHVPAN